ncbi:sigma-54-dependent Fis family transcriptional regulator [bacterium]|nr:sigma-54-dependent Fis family transcriptional regulator [bacterium]
MDNILIAEDNAIILEHCTEHIAEMGYQCVPVSNRAQAVEHIHNDSLEVVFTDLFLPDGDGFDVLHAVNEQDADIPVIIFTGMGKIDLAVKAMKAGAFDFLQKPITREMLEISIEKALKHRALRKEISSLQSRVESQTKLNNVVYESSIMRQIAKNVLKLGQSRTNVLIFGESGTGKELIARNIHAFSARKDKPFIPVDCVGFPATLLESELFGFEKGAFTGAYQAKPGVFELADGGTLFLDEITEMDYHMQAKLLRVLQERRFRRIGGKTFIDVDIRVISATNRDPEDAVKTNKFREDLYYRLNVVPVYLPPLRDRMEDIPLLVHHFIAKYNPFAAVEIKGISGPAMDALRRYTWPGNVREVENVIQRVISMADSDYIEYEHLPSALRPEKTDNAAEAFLEMRYHDAKKQCLTRFSKEYFDRLLVIHQGNISKVAQSAGISRKSIYRILEEYDIEHKM